MAKRLTDNINSLYFEAANKMTSKKARRKIVAYVESYDDVFFWRSVLGKYEDETRYFEILLPTRTDALIQKALKEYLPETTKIIIAQRISSVQNADKIIVLDDGKINAVGTHDELLKTCGIYREVFASQQKGESENA